MGRGAVRIQRVGPFVYSPITTTAIVGTRQDQVNPVIDDGANDGDYNGGFDSADPEINLGNNGTAKKGFLFFGNTGIPQGANIIEAYLILTSSANLNGTVVNLKLTGAAEDDPSAPTTANDAEGRPRTIHQTGWLSVDAWTANTEYQSPSIRYIIQEIVDRPGFASDGILIFMEDNGSTTNASRKAHSYNGDPAKAAVLHVVYDTAASEPYGLPTGVRVYRSTNLSLVHNVTTLVSFDAESFDSDGFYDAASPSRLTIPDSMGGLYLAYWNVSFANATNPRWRRVEMRKNGASDDVIYDDYRGYDSTSLHHVMAGVHPVWLADNEYVEMYLLQNAIDAQTINAEAQTDYSIVMGLQRLPDDIHGVMATRTDSITIPEATWTDYPMTADDIYDTDGFHDPTANEQRFTVPVGFDGYYLIGFSTKQQYQGHNITGISAEYNDGGFNNEQFELLSQGVNDDQAITNKICWIRYLSAGDTIDFMAYSSGNRVFEYVPINAQPLAWMFLLE
jgi:hypothetical protein